MGFEPTDNGFANRRLRPLGYAANFFNYNRLQQYEKFLILVNTTLPPIGRFCKKIKGKLYYFGSDRKIALQRYLEQSSYLHGGKVIQPTSAISNLSLKTLCNLYLEHQESRVAIGEIKWRQVNDQTILLRYFVKYMGSNRGVSDISAVDLQNYRTKLIRAGKAPNTINNRIAAIIC